MFVSSALSLLELYNIIIYSFYLFLVRLRTTWLTLPPTILTH